MPKKGVAPTSKLMNQVLPPLDSNFYPWDIPFAVGHEKQNPFKMQFASPKVTSPAVVNTTPPVSHHPIGTREGIAEKLIKYYGKGKNFQDEDDIYLEQYLHPEVDIIPKQPLRPTQLSKMPDMEFRHVAKDAEGSFNTAGLGDYSYTKNPDYASIYDIWDFNTESDLYAGDSDNYLKKAKNYAAKKFLQNVGTPYAVYERKPRIK